MQIWIKACFCTVITMLGLADLSTIPCPLDVAIHEQLCIRSVNKEISCQLIHFTYMITESVIMIRYVVAVLLRSEVWAKSLRYIVLLQCTKDTKLMPLRRSNEHSENEPSVRPRNHTVRLFNKAAVSCFLRLERGIAGVVFSWKINTSWRTTRNVGRSTILFWRLRAVTPVTSS